MARRRFKSLNERYNNIVNDYLSKLIYEDCGLEDCPTDEDDEIIGGGRLDDHGFGGINTSTPEAYHIIRDDDEDADLPRLSDYAEARAEFDEDDEDTDLPRLSDYADGDNEIDDEDLELPIITDYAK